MRRLNEALVGNLIIDVRIMNKTEAVKLGWTKRSIIITLSNGLELIPQSDNEGNGAGAILAKILGMDYVFPMVDFKQ